MCKSIENIVIQNFIYNLLNKEEKYEKISIDIYDLILQFKNKNVKRYNYDLIFFKYLVQNMCDINLKKEIDYNLYEIYQFGLDCVIKDIVYFNVNKNNFTIVILDLLKDQKIECNDLFALVKCYYPNFSFENFQKTISKKYFLVEEKNNCKFVKKK